MSTSSSSHEEIALRIGLAVRALPDTDIRTLINVLVIAVGQPLTLNKLAKLRFNRLRQACEGCLDLIADDDLKKALSLLKGRGVKLEEEPLPLPEAYRDGDMPGSIRMACSSDSGDRIDGHFGSCTRFLIYQIGAAEVRLVDIRDVPEWDADDDKNARRADMIGDCHVLATKSIGGPAAAKVVRAGLHPIKIADAISGPGMAAQLQTVLQSAPPPWLAKAMGESPEARIRFSQEASL
jgi:nitrogen fixation protein NifX